MQEEQNQRELAHAQILERFATQERRLSALETAAPTVPERIATQHQRQHDPCVCVIGGFGTKPRAAVLASMESLFQGVPGYVKVVAPGNDLKVCVATFNSIDSCIAFV